MRPAQAPLPQARPFPQRPGADRCAATSVVTAGMTDRACTDVMIARGTRRRGRNCS